MQHPNDLIIYQQVPLKPHTTFGIDVKARYFAEIDSEDKLQEILNSKQWEKLPKLILGGGSNILFTQDYQGLIIKIKIPGIHLTAEDGEHVWLKIGAGVNWHQFVMHCVHHQYAGVENLSLIPGTVGAAPIQNIGAYGTELKEVFDELEAIDINTGKSRVFKNSDCQFGYRDSVFKNIHKDKYIIKTVTLKLSKKPKLNLSYGAIQETLTQMGIETPTIRTVSEAVIKIRRSKLPDPNEIGNAGSFFKNPEISTEHFTKLIEQYSTMPHHTTGNHKVKVPAAWLIEQCGWKGKRIGDIGVHDKQALVLVNYGNGKGKDIKNLADEIRASVLEKFDIALVPEVNVI